MKLSYAVAMITQYVKKQRLCNQFWYWYVHVYTKIFCDPLLENPAVDEILFLQYLLYNQKIRFAKSEGKRMMLEILL